MRGYADRLDARQIGCGKDPAAQLGRSRYRSDPGMGMRAADKGHIHCAGQFDVGYELATSVKMPLVFFAQ
jgi:hypothetical protein